MKSTKWIVAFSLIAVLPVAAQAETAEEKGYRIAKEAEASDDGFGDYTVDGRMILRNKKGKESSREFSSMNLEMANDGDRGIIFFRTPKSSKGTALLTHGHKKKNDDQWLYLPALKRVKRISSGNKSGSFVGSEFSYEDLSSPELAKYTYRWVKDEPCPSKTDLTCHVIERFPIDKSSGYKRQVVWMETKTFRGFKIEYHDRKDAHLKTLMASGYKEFLGKHWRAGRMEMVNHQTGKSTVMEWTNYKFKTGLKESQFTSNRLKSLR